MRNLHILYEVGLGFWELSVVSWHINFGEKLYKEVLGNVLS